VLDPAGDPAAIVAPSGTRVAPCSNHDSGANPVDFAIVAASFA